MITETPTPTPTTTRSVPAGELLLFLIAFAIGGVAIAEAAFVAIGGMVLMVATVFLALAVTGGVVYAVSKAIGPEDYE